MSSLRANQTRDGHDIPSDRRLACTPGPHLHAGRRGRSRLGSRSRHSGGVSASQCDNSHDKVRDRP
eukprot:3244358-Prymnesium_polylepis.1